MSLPVRFLVPAKDGQPDLPKKLTVLDCTVRGNTAEVLVDPRSAKYLRQRRYASELELPKTHISVSQVNAYLRCPLSYYWRYVEGIRTPPTAAMSFGTAMHRAIEANNIHKVQHNENMPLTEVKKAWNEAWVHAAGYTDFTEDEDPGEIQDEGTRMLDVYMEQIAPTVQPILVEHVFEIDLGEGFTLKGIIDCVDQNGVIIDNKTTKRTPSGDPTSGNLQLVAYSVAHREILGMPESGVRLDYLIRTKTPKVVSFSGPPRNELEIRRTLKLISSTARAIRLGVFMPNPGNFMCSPTGCGYWDICHEQW